MGDHMRILTDVYFFVHPIYFESGIICFPKGCLRKFKGVRRILLSFIVDKRISAIEYAQSTG